MVIQTTTSNSRRASLMMEAVFALGLVVLVLLPLALSFAQDQRLVRSYYQRALVSEIIDSEMEILLAGDWHTFAPGAQDYPLNSAAAQNLPRGKARLTIADGKVRLEWLPERKLPGGPILREARVK